MSSYTVTWLADVNTVFKSELNVKVLSLSSLVQYIFETKCIYPCSGVGLGLWQYCKMTGNDRKSDIGSVLQHTERERNRVQATVCHDIYHKVISPTVWSLQCKILTNDPPVQFWHVPMEHVLADIS